MDAKENLYSLIEKLEERIEKLEQENIETTNCLYELQNQLDMMKPDEFNLYQFTLGE